MNAHTRFSLPRFSSASGAELWAGSVRLAGKVLPDEYRFIKWQVLARAKARPLAPPRNSQVILVSSARSGEGKTHVARNLVASLALDEDSEVTLIDANFDNPGLPNASLMGSYHKGLLDLLEHDKLDPKHAFLECNKANVHLLPGGRPRANSAELLNSERMMSLLGRLTAGGPNKIVVIDAASILAGTDAAMLAQFCGHVLFIVAEKGTRKLEIDQSLAKIEQLAWPIDNDELSFVLNRPPI
jgi:receptor protein-tyrosine kinase